MSVDDYASTAGTPRVLHVVGAMNVGGAETLLMNLFRGVDRSRVQFDFLVYGDEPGVYDQEIADLGGRVLRTHHSPARGVRAAVRAIRKILREEGPFLAVHAHILHASALAVRAAEAEGIPIRITHSHNTGDISGGIGRALYVAWTRREIAMKSTALIACGHQAGSYLFGDREWTVLPNRVSLAEFRPLPCHERMELRNDLSVPPEIPLIGAVARFEEVKNHIFLLGLAGMLRDRGVAFKMAFAGEGSLRRGLEERVRSEGLEHHVSFLGLRRDTARLMNAFDVLAMPSHYEGIPVVLMEAQACGLPCLVSDAVSEEVDYGLGLVRFLAIDSVDLWADAISAPLPLRAGAEDPAAWATTLRGEGADIEQSIDLLYKLYALSPR